MTRWGSAAVAVLLASAGSANAQLAASPTKPPPLVAIAGCRAMVGAIDLPEASGSVTAARVVPAQGYIPAYCEITGYLAPQQQFELRLPEKGWNGKYLQVGCGGMCPSVTAWLCDDPVRRGYACMAPDLGHRSGNDSRWARDSLEARVDFGFRAVHVATVAGKALVARRFGRAPDRAYFVGGSTGGRLAMVEAQRFPWDFDGVVSGAPILNQTAGQLAIMWGALAARGPDGRGLLEATDLRMLHGAVLDRCDMNDGVRDGLIGDPRHCRFDPDAIRCSPRRSTDCLSSAQVAAVRKMYAGPSDSYGRRLFPGGLNVGSELEWTNGYTGAVSRYADATDRFRNFVFWPAASADWRPEMFDWDSDYKRLSLMEGIYGAINPDLRRFRDAGGKILMVQGWSDEAALPGNTVDYYEAVSRLMGGAAETQAFFRLFMLPGGNHAGGGHAADRADLLAVLEHWVERGQAPDRIDFDRILEEPDVFALGAAIRAGTAPATLHISAGASTVYTTDPTNYAAFSRPAFPYPVETHYRGRGDPRLASSFGPAPSTSR